VIEVIECLDRFRQQAVVVFVPVPEAAGVETILAGARRQHKNDDRLLAEAVKTFDYLYHAYAQE
jgi:hypothetical protein